MKTFAYKTTQGDHWIDSNLTVHSLLIKDYAKPCYQPLWPTITHSNLRPTMTQNIHTMIHYDPKNAELFDIDLK